MLYLCLPVACAAYSRSNELIKVAILPFPSLLRKGFHYAELCAAKPEMEAPNAITNYSQELLNRLHDTAVGFIVKSNCWVLAAPVKAV